MKIVELSVSDYMGVEAVEIRPTDDVVTIGGRNGAGKSSVLNAIVSALGGAKEIPGVPVRDGGEQAVTRLTLSRPEGDLHVIRAIKPDGKTTLTVKSADGAKYGKPQQLLDGLVGAIGFDPHGFTRLDHKKQAEQLRELVGLDFSEIDDDRAKLYSERTDVNRDVRHLSARVESMPHHDDAPEAEVSVADLMKELGEAEQKLDDVANDEGIIDRVRNDRDACREVIRDLEDRLAKSREKLKALEVELSECISECGKTRAAADGVDINDIRQRIERADSENRKVRENAERDRVAKALAAHQKDADQLSDAIKKLDDKKSQAMAAASWPVEGLGFDESGGVTFQGRPFAQASSAEQLRVSLAMGMALNPKLRVLIIRDGSLIDEDTMAVIRDAVRDNEFQLWIERVSANGEGCTLVIEEGRVKDAVRAKRRPAKASA